VLQADVWRLGDKSGDRVLVKIVAFEGKHKLANRWEEDIYVVSAQPNPDVPVYVLHSERDPSERRTLHRNYLLPISAVLTVPSQAPPERTAASEHRAGCHRAHCARDTMASRSARQPHCRRICAATNTAHYE
jgi:hypothetical protein